MTQQAWTLGRMLVAMLGSGDNKEAFDPEPGPSVPFTTSPTA